MNEVISLIVLEHGLIAVMHLSVVCPKYLQYLGFVGERRGIDMSYWNKPPYLGHNPACVPPPYISLTNTPYLPVVHIFNTTKENIYAI